MIKRIEHVAVVVKNLDAAMKQWETLLGVKATPIKVLPTVKLAMLNFPGGAYVELVEPLGSEGLSAQHLAKYGEGIQHIGFEVDSVDAELERCSKAGAELVTPKARPAMDYMIGFIKTKPGDGVSLEFLQKVK